MFSARFFSQTTFLLSALAITFVWINSPTLSAYTVQVIAFLVILYFTNHLFLGDDGRFTQLLDGFIFAQVTLLLVSQTGKLNSPLFFLLYLLLFGLALFLGARSTLVFACGLVVFFLGEIRSLLSLVQLLGLVLMTPLALAFGRQYLEVLQDQAKIKILVKRQKELTSEVVQDEKMLAWLTLTLKEQLLQIIDTSSNLLADLSKLTINQKEGLTKINESAKKLLTLGEKMREKLER